MIESPGLSSKKGRVAVTMLVLAAPGSPRGLGHPQKVKQQPCRRPQTPSQLVRRDGLDSNDQISTQRVPSGVGGIPAAGLLSRTLEATGCSAMAWGAAVQEL